MINGIHEDAPQHYADGRAFELFAILKKSAVLTGALFLAPRSSVEKPCERFENPKSLNTPDKCGVVYFKNLSPLGKRMRFVVEFYNNIIAPVKCLILPRRPSAIFFAVILVVIYSVQSVTLWSRTHIFKKIFKVEPSITHGNTPAAVRLVACGFAVIAAMYHRLPGVVFRCIGFAVSKIELRNSFYSGASAAYNMPTANMEPIAANFIAAFTFA